MNEDVRKQIGALIKKLRLEQKISQTELGKCAGIPKQRVYAIEQGISGNAELMNNLLNRLGYRIKITVEKL